MNQAENDVLLAGLRLRNQHTKETFQAVTEMLKRRDQDPYLISLFEMLQEMSELDSPKQKQASKKASFSLDEVQAQDPERHALLLELQGLLTSKKIFSKKQPLAEFVSRKVPHLDPNNPKGTMMEIAGLYLEAIRELPLDEIISDLQVLKDPRLVNPKHQKAVDSFLRMADRIVLST